MGKLKAWFGIILILAIGILIHFEFPFNDKGVVFKDEKFSERIPSRAEAQNALTTDTVDHFFEKISLVDIELQMKRNLTSNVKENPKTVYQNYLRNEIGNFSFFEKRTLKRIADDVFKKLESKTSFGDPHNFQIVKITKNIYGENIFFTRNKTIFLTEDFFKLNEQQQAQTFAHELSHIFSRYLKGYKEKLYPTIGFRRWGVFSHFMKFNQNKNLLNPDGVNSDWYFQFIIFDNPEDSTFEKFEPLIVSKDTLKKRKNYFENCEFRLLKINRSNSNNLYEYSPQMTIDVYNNYFKENYGITYTIHPDEIIADLFAQWLIDEEKNLLGFENLRGLKNLKRQTFEAFKEVLRKQNK